MIIWCSNLFWWCWLPLFLLQYCTRFWTHEKMKKCKNLNTLLAKVKFHLIYHTCNRSLCYLQYFSIHDVTMGQVDSSVAVFCWIFLSSTQLQEETNSFLSKAKNARYVEIVIMNYGSNTWDGSWGLWNNNFFGVRLTANKQSSMAC